MKNKLSNNISCSTDNFNRMWNPPYDDWKRKFKEKMEQLLEDRNLTCKQLASAIHRSNITVKRWINGERIPNANDLNNIAKALNVTVDEICRFTDKIDSASMGNGLYKTYHMMEELSNLLDSDNVETDDNTLITFETKNINSNTLEVSVFENYIFNNKFKINIECIE